MKPIRSLALLPTVIVWLAAAFTGCAGFMASKKPLPDVSAADLLRRVGEHSHRIETIEGVGSFSMLSGMGGMRGQIKVVARLPDSLWLRLEGPMGVDLVTARFAGGRIRYFSPWMPEAKADSSVKPALRAMLPAGLDSLDALLGLFGMPGLAKIQADSIRSLSKDDGRYVLRFSVGESLWIDPEGPVVSRWEKRNANGELVWSYAADRYFSSGGVRIPRTIQFRAGEDREFQLYYDEIKTNHRLKKGWCDVRTPKGADAASL
jgi:hypothetical protein